MTRPPPEPHRHPWRRRLLLAGWLVGGLVILGRAGVVQVLQGSQWTETALGQHRETKKVSASRGAILDRNGEPLANSHETFRVGVAPREIPVGTREAVYADLASELALTRSLMREVSDPDRTWVHIPGTYPPRIQKKLRLVTMTLAALISIN